MSSFIRVEIEAILEEWEKFARTIHSARDMNPADLRDHARQMLMAIATDMERPQSLEAQKEKSLGLRPSTNGDTASTKHGFDRQTSGFSISETMSEFRALRASVVALWKRRTTSWSKNQIDELTRFNEAIDEAVHDSVVSYADEKERHTRLFGTVLGASPDATFVLDDNCQFVYANQAMEMLYDLPMEKIVGASACDSGFPLDAEVQTQILRVIASGKGHSGELTHRVAERDVKFEYHLVPVLSDDQALEAVVGILHDITQRKIAEEETWHNANFDLLTGLPNRRLFFDRLEQDVEHSARTGLALAVLYIDLNGFKEVNDRFGHQAGDRLLRDVAERLNTSVRKSDTVARIGGDEFTVMLTDLHESRDVNAVAEKISEALEFQIEYDGEAAHISASIGIAVCPKDAGTPEDLLRNADSAMYWAKSSERRKICFYDGGSASRH